MISFQTEVKMELYSLEIKSICCAKSEYAAIRFTTRSKVKTKSVSYAERIRYLIKKVQGVDLYVNIISNKNKTEYEIVFPEYKEKYDINEDCCKRSFIRGCYITSGRINDHDKPTHLELSFKDKLTYSLCLSCLDYFDIGAKILERDKRYLIYFKNQESVSDLLTIIGAHKAVCNFENARIIKEIRNNTNRAVNCDNANIQKANDAAYRQITAIEDLIRKQKLNSLPEYLIQTAIARIENPELDLTELGNILNPSVSKAGVAHRLNKIIQYSLGQEDY